ncbi:uncharacterized protein LOC129222701 [Uloborus diversus]|uniref:uncharacterized protein LOC129222701 n=1 Tax=Uloborus diversus TaxID=327109 RepID=UPI0024097EE5|nr:uncharacterized protein LOC129222701 [Uloborus diversus]
MLSLRQMISSIISSNFGENKSYKIVVDGKDNYFCQCPLLLLQKVHLKDPLTCLIEETLFAHHEQFGCSTTSLLTMWYLWDDIFHKLMEEGCEVKDIIKYVQVFLENVISQISEVTFKVDQVLFPKTKTLANDICGKALKKPSMLHQSSWHNLYKVMPEKAKNLSAKSSIGLKYSSRHFSPFLASEIETNVNEEIPGMDKNIFQSCPDSEEHLSKETTDRLYAVVCKLSRGNEEYAKLAHKIWVQQILTTKSLKFNTESIIICPITTSSAYSSVIQGLLIKSNFRNFESQDFKINESCRALVIKGSITFEYVHLGFNPKISITKQKTAENYYLCEREVWIKKCCSLISKLKITLLFVRGDVDPEIASFCHSLSILIFSNLPSETMKVLHTVFNPMACAYLLDCDVKNILSNVSIQRWNTSQKETQEEYYLVNNKCYEKAHFHTVVLCHPSSSVLSSHVHQFWHLLSRLHHGSEHSLLPGCGKSENWCSKILEKTCIQNSIKLKIATALAQGFSSYSKILQKEKDSDPINDMLDDTHSKVNSWRSALSLVLMTLQCDLFIINGSDYVNDVRLNELVSYL